MRSFSSSFLSRNCVKSTSSSSSTAPVIFFSSLLPSLVTPTRALSSFGRITDEDRRWWLVHLECAPDVTAGTFISWLDNCGTHTTKKLIERNIWTIEQVANLSSDQVDELRYKEGCLHMDVVWEHARTVLVPLKARQGGMSAEHSSLQDRILELRKKRELEKRRREIIDERKDTVQSREDTLRALRDQVEKKRQMLRMRQQAAAAARQDNDNDDENSGAEDVVNELGKKQ